MCGYSDCPKTDERIRGQLCDLYYPYGGIKCRRHFNRWLENEEEVQKIHKEYLEKV